MQGYIVNVQKVKDEDLIVSILSENNFYTTYRFYGARHSNINIGFKIDFELELSLKNDMPRLKDVIHLSYPWIDNRTKLYDWQRFLKLFYLHLQDIDYIDKFYFDLLDTISHKITKQNQKRAIVESYIKLCEYEGRLHIDMECVVCENLIKDKISLIRGFLPTHITCSYSKQFALYKILNLFIHKHTLDFTDEEVEYLWYILLQGL